MSAETITEQVVSTRQQPGPFFTVFIDDVEYRFDHSPVSGRELMDIAGIPHDTGLILILEDNTQQQVGLDEMIDLKPGRRFKKAPRFKRGLQ